MKQKRRGPGAATLGNFVVKVALRITDARQEVGTAEAARGPDTDEDERVGEVEDEEADVVALWE